MAPAPIVWKPVAVTAIPRALDLVCAAPRRTAAEGTARLFIADTPTPADIADADWRGEGVIDFVRDRASITGTGVSRRRIDEAKGLVERILLLPVSGTVESQVWDGADAFFKIGEAWHRAAGDPPAPKPYGHPLWLWGVLPSTTTASENGEAHVQGVKTTRFRATVDLEASATAHRNRSHLPSTGAPNRLARWLLRRDRRWGRAMPVELWIDGEGRIRRYAWVPLSPPRRGRVVWQVRPNADRHPCPFRTGVRH